VAGNIAAAWAMTLPAAGLFGAVVYWLQSALGAGVFGPVAIWVIAVAVLASIIVVRRTRFARAAQA
jgi:PiT family inorganic phosphate transporter